MKKVMFLFVFLCLMNALGNTSELKHTLKFDKNSLIFEKKDGYDLVKLKKAHLLYNVGEPALPIRNIYLVLPDDAQVVGLDILSVQKEKLSPGFSIFPAQPSLPLVERQQTVPLVQPKAEVYKSFSPYPKSPIKYIRTGSFGGRRIAILQVFPLQYIPAEKTLHFYSKIEFKLNYTTFGENLIPSSRKPKAQAVYDRMIEKLVENPGTITSKTVEQRLQGDQIEYLIITPASCASAFQPLADWKVKKGVPVMIKDLIWIQTYFTGRDLQESIRNCIKSVYENYGLVWVLLAGDTDSLPCRYAYIQMQSISESIPSDLYYADLDGDWNWDGDDLFGEPEDSIDLFPDVFVGRAPVKSLAEAENFVNKVLTYEKNPPLDYQKKVLFMAEYADARTDNGIGKDMIDQYFIPSRFDPIAKLYERNGNENAAACVDSMNQGFNFINHAGHANFWVMGVGPDYLSSSDMDGLSNSPRFSGVFYSVGCWPAAIDYNCIAEHFVNSPNGGGFFIGNSRFGWYTPSFPGYGSSDLFDQQFFASMFERGFHRIGEAFNDSKIQFLGDADQQNDFRWLQFTLNLLGEPEMPLWTDTPGDLIVDFPETVFTDSCNFIVTVTDGFLPIENALVCIQKPGEINLSEATNALGQISFFWDSLTPDSLSITVTQKNFVPFEGTATLVSDIPYVMYKSHSIDDQLGNKDGLISPGDTINLGVTLKNFGNQPAYGVQGVLSSADSLVTVVDSMGSYGDLLSGQEFAGIYTFYVSPFCLNDYPLLFNLNIKDNENHTWNFKLSLKVATPILKFNRVMVLDGPGGDGKADPGDTVNLRLYLENVGGAKASGVSASLTTLDSANIFIISDSVFLGDVPPKDTVVARSYLIIGVQDSSPNHHPSAFILELKALNYSGSDTFEVLIGSSNFTDYMEKGENGWTNSGSLDSWHLNNNRYHSYFNSWYCGQEGTHLYSPNFTAYLVSPIIVVPNNARFSFWSWHVIESGYDYGYCEINDGSGWKVLSLITGASDDWVKREYDLSPYFGDSIQIRFTFFSDNDYAQYEGWYIDDFKIFTTEKSGISGDVDCNGQIALADVIYLARYLLQNGRAPCPTTSGDVNCGGSISLSDVIYLANYLLKGGNPPCE